VTDAVDRYTPTNGVAEISAMEGMKYKFQEHESEQTAIGNSISVQRPNSGYTRMPGHVTI
jgi:hypothetical protein